MLYIPAISRPAIGYFAVDVATVLAENKTRSASDSKHAHLMFSNTRGCRKFLNTAPTFKQSYPSDLTLISDTEHFRRERECVCVCVCKCMCVSVDWELK